jgi:hypothetical protein
MGAWYFFANTRVDTINPEYHLRRYVGAERDIDLRTAGVCPGSWDLTENDPGRFIPTFLLKLRSSPKSTPKDASENEADNTSSVVLHDVQVVVDSGRDSRQVLSFIEELDLATGGEFRVTVDEWESLQIFASSTPEGLQDIRLASSDTPSPGVEDITPGNDAGELFLVQSMPDGSQTVVGVAELGTLPVTVLSDDFESISPLKPSLQRQAARTSQQVLADPGLCGGQFLELTKTGGGKGTVTSEPQAIDCGSDCTTETQAFASGSVVELKATAIPGQSVFTGWGGVENCDGSQSPTCLVSMTENREIEAEFACDAPPPIIERVDVSCPTDGAPPFNGYRYIIDVEFSDPVGLERSAGYFGNYIGALLFRTSSTSDYGDASNAYSSRLYDGDLNNGTIRYTLKPYLSYPCAPVGGNTTENQFWEDFKTVIRNCAAPAESAPFILKFYSP